MDEPRPHKVQKILHLEDKAATSRAEYESTLARITPAKRKAQQYDQEAKALKVQHSHEREVVLESLAEVRAAAEQVADARDELRPRTGDEGPGA